MLKARVLLPGTFVVASVVAIVLVGVPITHDVMALWLLAGLLCFSLTDLRGYWRGVIRDWIPFFGLLIAYDSLRGTAGRLFGVHYRLQAGFDNFIFGGHNPTVVLQRWLWHGTVTWYDVGCWCVYMTHFLATPILAAVLWKLDRDRFRRYAVAVLVLSFAALATFALYPAAPPWLASKHGVIGPVTRLLGIIPKGIGAHSLGGLVETGVQYSNNVAAVPSLHAGYSLLIAITLWPRRRWLRPLVALYPLAMAFSLIYMGEHYLFDIVVGWSYTAATVLSLRQLRAWRAARVAAPTRVAVEEPLAAAIEG